LGVEHPLRIIYFTTILLISSRRNLTCTGRRPLWAKIEDIRNKLNPIFEEKNVIKAVLFGSYTKGEATEESDIDIVALVDDEMSILNFCDIDPPIEVCQANYNHPPKRGDCDTNIAERFNWCRNIADKVI